MLWPYCLQEAGGLYNIHKGFLLFLICFQDTTPALHADEGKLTFTLLFFFRNGRGQGGVV